MFQQTVHGGVAMVPIGASVASASVGACVTVGGVARLLTRRGMGVAWAGQLMQQGSANSLNRATLQRRSEAICLQ